MSTACLAMPLPMSRETQSEPDDFDLVRRARSGDVRSFEQLYRRHVGRVHGAVWRLSGMNPARAEELAQERRQIEHILDEGQKSGDFALPADLTITADLVQCAMMKFRIPQLWTTEKLEALRAELEGVLSLIFTGLSARR